MNHATTATFLYRVACCIEVLAKWCPPVKNLMLQHVKTINSIADWHQNEFRANLNA